MFINIADNQGQSFVIKFHAEISMRGITDVLATLANKIFLILVHHAFGLRRGQCTSFLPIMDYVGPS